MGKSLKVTQWLCKRCGSHFDSEIAADSCYNMHANQDDLDLKLAVLEGASVYEPGTAFPSIIEVRDKRTNNTELYAMTKFMRSSPSQPVVAKRGVQLEA